MNISTTPRQWALALVSFLFLLTGQKAQAQCPITTIPPAPVSVQVVVDQITGMATFSSNDVTGIISTAGACDPVVAYKIRFYQDQAKTIPHPYTPPVFCLGGGSTVTLTCSDINTTKAVWAAINDGDAPGGAICGEFDASSESAAVLFNVNVLDKTAPEAVAPANITVDAGPACTASAIAGIGMVSVVKVAHPSVLAAGRYTDNCLSNVNVSYYLSGATTLGSAMAPIAGANAGVETFNLGVTTVTYIINDTKYTPGSATNPVVVSFTVTVRDVTVPTITCPFGPGFNTNVNTDPGVCTTTIASGLQPVATSDNCANPPALTYTLTGATTSAPNVAGNVNGLTFNLGMTTVTYQVADNAMPANTATCQFTVTVMDMQAPALTVTSGSTVGMTTYNATPANGASFNVGTSTAPGAPLCDGTYSWNHPTMADNCSPLAFPPASLTMELLGPLTVAAPVPVMPGDNFTQTFNGLGLTTVRYIATDNNSKTSSLTFTVNVVDDVAPVLAPPPPPFSISVTVTPGDCAKVITFARPAAPAISDCGMVSITETYVSGPDPNVLAGAPAFSYGSNVTLQFPAGTTVIRYTWSDGIQSTTVDYTFTVVENQLPNAVCVPGPVTVPLNQFGVALVTAAMINNGSSDNCGINEITVSPAFFDCSAIGTNPNPVVLTVKDNAGNIATCNSSVFVQDNAAPVIGCPSTFVVNAGPSCNGTVSNLKFDVTSNLPPNPNTMEYWDNSFDPCGVTFDYQINAAPIVSLGAFNLMNSEIDLSNVVFPPGSNTVTLRATDISGNIAACNFTVTVDDENGPTFSGCPSAIADVAGLGGCGKTISWIAPTWEDNCTDPVTNVVNSHNPAGTFFGLGTTIVSHTATDGAGNRTTCSFTVTITDGQPPVANCKPATVTLGPAGTFDMPASQIDNNSTDNCFYTYQSGPYTFNCSHVGVPQTVILTIVDQGGQTSSCPATVTVLDGQAPTALCNLIPTTLNLSASDCVPPSDPGTVRLTAANVGNATDNCLGNVQYQISVDGSAQVNSFDFNCSHIGVRQVTLRAFDSAGSTTCGPVAVTIRDVSAPCFSVPAAIVVDCNDGNPNLIDPSNTGNPTNVVDNCDAAPTVTYADVVSGVIGCPNALNIQRTWTVTDHAVPANSSSQVQNIQIRDVTGPVWTLATSYAVNTVDPNICTVASPIPAVVAGVNVSDACGTFTVTYGIAYPAGSPLVNVPGGTPLPGNGLVPNQFPIGVSTVTFVAVDECSNASTRTVTVTVSDVHAPVFSYNRCGQTYTLPNTTNNCDQLFTWGRPTALDLFDCKGYTVDELISNTSVQTFVDIISPWSWNPPAGNTVVAQFPVGTTTVTYIAEDASGNTSSCTFRVVIQDTQAPSITCPMNQELPITAGCTSITEIPNYRTLTSVVDNCLNNVVLTQAPDSGLLVSSVVPVVPGNSFTVTLKATDGQPLGLMSPTCTFTVTLVDGESPVPDTLALPPISSFCGKDTVDAPSATDCNGVSFVTIYGTPSVPVMMTLPPTVPGGPPRYVLNAGSYVITWSYTDAQNNTTTQPQNVTIAVDNIPPTAICKPITVDLSATGSVTVNAAQSNNGSFDQHNCGPVSLTYRTGTNPNFTFVPSLAFGCANLGVNNVVFAATDVNNNTATCATTITVRDVTKPVIANVPNDTTIQACATIPAQAVLTATDACDSNVPVIATATTTQDTSFEVCGHYNYTITRRWTATDDSGNTQTVTQVITIQDTQAPVFSSPDSIVVLTDPNRTTCNDTVFLNMLNFIADCAPDSELVVTNTLNPLLGANVTGVYALGSHTISFTATDKCGNVSTKSIKLVVRDATLPTAVCINGISVSLQSGGMVSLGTVQMDNNSFDNCGIASMQVQRLDPITPLGNSVSFSCNDADAVTQHPVRLVVYDVNGNQSACETFVVVQDNVPPTITCPANLTVLCNANTDVSATGAATATDNCPILANAISHFDTMITGMGSTCHILKRVWMARDLSGNISSCDQLIALLDTIKPVLSVYPPDITISCADPVPNPQNVTATDNCDQTLVVQFEQDTVNIASGNCGKYDYTIVRTRIVSDDCGNTETDVRRIKVVDNTPPRFLGMPNSVTFESANFPPSSSCTVPVTFNAGQYFVECAPLSECVIDTVQFIPAVPGLSANGLDISGIYPVGTTKVVFSVTDPCGNKGRDTIDIVVVDNSVPTLVCNNNVVIALGSNGEASIETTDIDLGSTDNCGIDTLYLDLSTFDCADLGLNTVRLTAEDIYGNSNFCEVEVEVTLGANAGFNLTATGIAESFFGSGDGVATTVVGGGSGMFTYTWSNQATTPTIGSLAAGTYTVTVVDTNTGCVNIDTAVVSAGKQITINIDSVGSCQGLTVTIPVTVENFLNVSGFSFGLQLDNATVGTITAITDVNPALTGLVPGVNSVFWTNGNPTVGVTLPNGALLFNLQVQLANAPTPVGTTSTISASALPALVFLQPINNVPTQAGQVVFNEGDATISCIAADIEVAGVITTWRAPNYPILNVDVELTGTILGSDLTALPAAEYSFLVPAGANTVVTPSKTATAKSTKINVGDLLFIQAHAAPPAVQIPFTSPYQWLAADINGDKLVNIVDYALVQSYIVNNAITNGQFNFNPAPPDWKFVPKAYVFPAPNPLNPAPPSSINNPSVIADILNDDFIGVLLGDVNGDVAPPVGGTGIEYSQDLKLRISDRSVQSGEVVKVDFKAKDFMDLQAYQLTIAFDPAKFELQGITPGVLPEMSDANFGTTMVNEGLLAALWVGSRSTTVADNEVLFSLTFKALGQVQSLSDVLFANADIAEPMAVDAQGTTLGVDFEFTTSVGTGEAALKSFVLFQNQPNPFSEATNISFRLPDAGRAKINIFGTDGRLVKTLIGDYPAGSNTVTVRKDELGRPGVYWYELETLQYSDRKKMILID